MRVEITEIPGSSPKQIAETIRREVAAGKFIGDVAVATYTDGALILTGTPLGCMGALSFAQRWLSDRTSHMKALLSSEG